MARITLRQLLDHAAEHAYGVPAFNINNMEQGLAIMEAAKACDAPVIIQASRGARSYANDIMLAKMIDALAEIYPEIPVCMHQDHGNNEATCLTAIRHGFTSVMMDGSLEADARTPASYEYNVEITERLNRELGLKLTDAFCGFKAYRTQALGQLSLTETGYAMPLELWVQAARAGLKVIELPVPLVYLDESRSFGGMLDDAATRLAYYHLVLDRSIAAAGLADGVVHSGSICGEGTG